MLAAFRVLADPTATLDARIGAVQDGEALREQVAAGLADDTPRAGAVAFNVEGARLVDADHTQILYSLVASGEPRLETPYPVVASAVRVDGVWRVARRYACGLTAARGSACSCRSRSRRPRCRPSRHVHHVDVDDHEHDVDEHDDDAEPEPDHDHLRPVTTTTRP